MVFGMLALLFAIPFSFEIYRIDSYAAFKSNLKTHLLSGASIAGPEQLNYIWFLLIFAFETVLFDLMGDMMLIAQCSKSCVKQYCGFGIVAGYPHQSDWGK